MKIIDEKGRLFGKINIIDLCVIIVLLLIIAAVCYKSIGSDIKTPVTAVSGDVRNVVIGIKCNFKSESIAQALKVGDNLVANNRYQDVTIKSVTYSNANFASANSEGLVVLTKDPLRKDIYVLIEGKADVSKPYIRLANQDIRIGANFFIKTQTVDVSGVVDRIDIH